MNTENLTAITMYAYIVSTLVFVFFVASIASNIKDIRDFVYHNQTENSV